MTFHIDLYEWAYGGGTNEKMNNQVKTIFFFRLMVTRSSQQWGYANELSVRRNSAVIP